MGLNKVVDGRVRKKPQEETSVENEEVGAPSSPGTVQEPSNPASGEACKTSPLFPPRLLVSYKQSYSFFVEFPAFFAPNGVVIQPAVSVILRLTGDESIGNVAGKSDEMAYRVRRAVASMELPVEMAERVSVELGELVLPGRRVYKGCSLLLDERVAREVTKLLDDDPEDDRIKKPRTAYDKMMDYVLSRHSYGEKMAFVDDEEAMAGLIPQFEKNILNERQEGDAKDEYIANQALMGDA